MLTIKCMSEKPCFICGNTQKTAEVVFADKTFRGVLCIEHIYKKLQGKEVASAAGQSGGKPT